MFVYGAVEFLKISAHHCFILLFYSAAGCGVPNREARLVGGEYLRGHEFPWAASIQILEGDKTAPATLINDRYLVTSASVLIG